MADKKIDLTGAKFPAVDGDINEYISQEAVASGQFDASRRVVFINGMGNSGENHAESAVTLSLLQMATVIGVYNATGGFGKDFLQCIADKNQFDGPASLSAKTKVALGGLMGGLPVDVARAALARNAAQVPLFELLRKPGNKKLEIFAHSQGNLILSNVLQAIAAVDGPAALVGYTVNTFGSPAVNWPAGLRKFEHGFTFDYVAFLAGFDASWSISKVGLPGGLDMHGFLGYMRNDPAFVVNRYRVGGLKMTFNMDEAGLADAIIAMGGNIRRVSAIFVHLDKKHNSDADDVAELYVNRLRKSPATAAAIRADRSLVALLVRILDDGWTSAGEKAAIEFLRGN